jgi:hypothetical protein
MSRDLPQLRVCHMPSEMDANDVLREQGVEKFLALCDLEEIRAS